MNNENSMEELNFRVREMEYSDGSVRFIPELLSDRNEWVNIARPILGFNQENKLDYCSTFDEAKTIIERVKVCLGLIESPIKLVNEKTYYNL